MKRILVLASIAAFTLSSCNRTEKLSGGTTVESPNVSFDTYLGGRTKGLSKDDFRMGDQFSTFGVKTPNNFDTLNPAFTEYVFASQSVVVSHYGVDGAGNSIWNYDELAPWDENKATFFAYSPVPQAGKTFGITNPTIADNTIPSIDYQVVGGYDVAITSLADPAVAAARALIKTQPDLLSAFSADNVKAGGTIPLDFGHALSQIRFSVRGHHTDGLLRINSVTLKKVNSKATLKLAHDLSKKGELDYLGGWSAATEPQNFDVNLQTEAVSAIPKTTAGQTPTLWPITDDDESLMMIPQILTGIELEVRYSYSIDGLAWTDYETGTAMDFVLSTISTHWNPNKRYNYILNIHPGQAITFTSTIDPWEPTSGSADLEYRQFDVAATAGNILNAAGTDELFELRQGDKITATYSAGSDWVSAVDEAGASVVANGTPNVVTDTNAGKWTFKIAANATAADRTATIVIERAEYDKTLVDGITTVKVKSGVAKYIVKQNAGPAVP